VLAKAGVSSPILLSFTFRNHFVGGLFRINHLAAVKANEDDIRFIP